MPKQILIVEDTLDLLENILEVLQMESYEVLSASNGKEGLDRMSRSTPDIIITDLMMPEMNGFEFIKKIRENNLWDNIPILVFSAMPLLENEKQVLAIGANAYLKKPCNINELLEAVKNLIMHKRINIQ